MIAIALPLAAAAFAAALTWWCCLRPMRRRLSCHNAPATGAQDELRRARKELRQLRAQAARPKAAPPSARAGAPEILDT